MLLNQKVRNRLYKWSNTIAVTVDTKESQPGKTSDDTKLSSLKSKIEIMKQKIEQLKQVNQTGSLQVAS